MTSGATVPPVTPAESAPPAGRPPRRGLIVLGGLVVVALILLSLMLAGILPGYRLAPGSGAKSPHQYDVNFTQTGLSPGTSWSVSLHGTLTASHGATITFEESNGTYPFTILGPDGFESNISAGSVTVGGTSVSTAIGFVVTLTTTLTATPVITQVGEVSVLGLGLAGGFAPVTWTLTRNGSSANLTGAVDGQYRFTPSAAATYTLYLNATDRIGKTSGSTASVTVAPALGASFSSPLVNVTVDKVANLSISFSGGVPPVSWTLEMNGSSTNLSGVVGGVYAFTPDAVGVYTFYLNATDSVGSVSRATATVNCSAPSYLLGMSEVGAAEPAADTYWVELALTPTSGLTTGVFGLEVTSASSTTVPGSTPSSSCTVGAVFEVSHCAAAVDDSDEWYGALVYANGTIANVFGSGGWTGPTVTVTGEDTVFIVSGADLDGIGDVLSAFATGSASVSGSVTL